MSNGGEKVLITKFGTEKSAAGNALYAQRFLQFAKEPSLKEVDDLLSCTHGTTCFSRSSASPVIQQTGTSIQVRLLKLLNYQLADKLNHSFTVKQVTHLLPGR